MRSSEPSATTIRWRTDPRGRFTFWSGRSGDFLGISRNAIVGRQPGDLSCAEPAGDSARFAWPLSGNRPFSGKRVIWTSPAGRKVLTLNYGTPHRDSSGRIRGFAGTLMLWDADLVNFPDHIVHDEVGFCQRLEPLLTFAAATHCGLALLMIDRIVSRDLYRAGRLLCEDALLLWEDRQRLYAVFSCPAGDCREDLFVQLPRLQDCGHDRLTAAIVSQNPVHVTHPRSWLYYLDRALVAPPEEGGVVCAYPTGRD